MAKYVKSVVKINKMAIKALDKAAITALEQTGDALMGDVVDKQVIPFNVGTLQNESTHLDTDNSKNGVVRIISSTPYARRLYYHPEYNFQTINNPNAKGNGLKIGCQAGSMNRTRRKLLLSSTKS